MSRRCRYGVCVCKARAEREGMFHVTEVLLEHTALLIPRTARNVITLSFCVYVYNLLLLFISCRMGFKKKGFEGCGRMFLAEGKLGEHPGQVAHTGSCGGC